ncbi:MAG: HNH endonuclease [Ignavibacteriales bacterium]|nr:HNH endonuclease [Ignavibacteriales bacterium]
MGGLTGETALWPDDDMLKDKWLTSNAYFSLNQQKIVYILKQLNSTYLTKRNEPINYDFDPTIEHIMPQKWQSNWPLPDGLKGLEYMEAQLADISDLRKQPSIYRESKKNTFGNLTILTQSLNSVVSNSSWEIKKPEILLSSLLPINQKLVNYATWDEETINERALEMFEQAIILWPSK